MKNVIVPMQNMSLVRRVLLELKEKFIKNSNKYTANIDVFCELEVRDKDGKLVSYRKFKSKSFVKNFLAMVYNYFIVTTVSDGYNIPSGVTGVPVTDVNGNALAPLYVRTNTGISDIVTNAGHPNTSTYNIFMISSAILAPANNDSYGIVIGTGTTTPTATDYNLGSKLANTSMTHSAMQIDGGLTAVSSTNYIFKITRTFTNNTPNTINVSEAGVIAQIPCWNTATSSFVQANVLLLHDTFTAQAVASGQVLTVRYTISITT